MKTTAFFILTVCICVVAVYPSKTGVKNVSKGSVKTQGKVVVNQHCNSAAIVTEISSLKEEVKTMKKELTQRLDKRGSKDPWIKLNTAPVCFGTKNNQFGKFTVPVDGRLASVKLVHFYGYVTCQKSLPYSYSYWGCSIYHSTLKDHVGVVITTSANHILLPSSQFMTDSYGKYKWSKILGYNSFSPEIVLSAFSNPPTVSKGQELRLWYNEDLTNVAEHDNDGTSCCDVFARFI